jgi:N-acetylmuramoyl-L-alanine amidase
MCDGIKHKRFLSATASECLSILQKNFGEGGRLGIQSGMPAWIRNGVLIVLTGILSACASAPSGTTKIKNTIKTFNTVIVDAGHGGKDTGAYRRYGGAEKTATLDVARRLNRKLQESQLHTIMTRSSDVFIPLEERVSILNRQKNAILVSIHFNDSRRRGIRGFETYYHAPAARDLADRIQRKLMTIPRSANRGIHTANFHVLRFAGFPAVLVECGFLSNRREGGEVRDASYRELLADKIAEAVVEQRFGTGVYMAKAPTIAPEGTEPQDSGLAPPKTRTR